MEERDCYQTRQQDWGRKGINLVEGNSFEIVTIRDAIGQF
jgi:hypothetical protein